MQQCGDCQAALEDTKEAWHLYATHVPSEFLVDYGLGRASTGLSRRLIERHLSECESCSEELTLIQSEPSETEATTPAALKPATQAPWRRLALAASLVALVAAGALITGRGKAPLPQTNVAVIEILPESMSLRGDGTDVTIPRGLPASLVLVTDRVPHATSVRVRLLDVNGETVWEAGDLTRADSGEFTLLLPARSAPAGPMTIEIMDFEDDRWQVLESYRVRLGP
jgi:hypothetical protein